MSTFRAVPLLFDYPGSKAYLTAKLLPLIPDHDHYVSVFGGSAADVLGKPRSRRETYNDRDPDLARLFRVIQSPPAVTALCQRVEATPYSRAAYGEALRRLRDGGLVGIDWALAYLIVARQKRRSTSAALAVPSEWSCSGVDSRARPWARLARKLPRIANRLRGVGIECDPWEDVLRRYDGSRTHFYLDPPYLPATRPSPRLYRHEMTEDDHRRLLGAVTGLRGTAMLSGYPSRLYRDALADWRAVRFPTSCYMSGRARKPPREEVVWMNYDARGRRLPAETDFSLFL